MADKKLSGGKKSRDKGARGERDVAKIIRGFARDARRGQQFSGSTDSPDVVADLPGYHLEVKRTEALSLYKAMGQAKRDAGDDKTPVVVHRRNGEDWLAIIDFKAFLELITGMPDMSDLFE